MGVCDGEGEARREDAPWVPRVQPCPRLCPSPYNPFIGLGHVPPALQLATSCHPLADLDDVGALDESVLECLKRLFADLCGMSGERARLFVVVARCGPLKATFY